MAKTLSDLFLPATARPYLERALGAHLLTPHIPIDALGAVGMPPHAVGLIVWRSAGQIDLHALLMAYVRLSRHGFSHADITELAATPEGEMRLLSAARCMESAAHTWVKPAMVMSSARNQQDLTILYQVCMYFPRYASLGVRLFSQVPLSTEYLQKIQEIGLSTEHLHKLGINGKSGLIQLVDGPAGRERLQKVRHDFPLLLESGLRGSALVDRLLGNEAPLTSLPPRPTASPRHTSSHEDRAAQLVTLGLAPDFLAQVRGHSDEHLLLDLMERYATKFVDLNIDLKFLQAVGHRALLTQQLARVPAILNVWVDLVRPPQTGDAPNSDDNDAPLQLRDVQHEASQRGRALSLPREAVRRLLALPRGPAVLWTLLWQWPRIEALWPESACSSEIDPALAQILHICTKPDAERVLNLLAAEGLNLLQAHSFSAPQVVALGMHHDACAALALARNYAPEIESDEERRTAFVAWLTQSTGPLDIAQFKSTLLSTDASSSPASLQLPAIVLPETTDEPPQSGEESLHDMLVGRGFDSTLLTKLFGQDESKLALLDEVWELYKESPHVSAAEIAELVAFAESYLFLGATAAYLAEVGVTLHDLTMMARQGCTAGLFYLMVDAVALFKHRGSQAEQNKATLKASDVRLAILRELARLYADTADAQASVSNPPSATASPLAFSAYLQREGFAESTLALPRANQDLIKTLASRWPTYRQAGATSQMATDILKTATKMSPIDFFRILLSQCEQLHRMKFTQQQIDRLLALPQCNEIFAVLFDKNDEFAENGISASRVVALCEEADSRPGATAVRLTLLIRQERAARMRDSSAESSLSELSSDTGSEPQRADAAAPASVLENAGFDAAEINELQHRGLVQDAIRCWPRCKEHFTRDKFMKFCTFAQGVQSLADLVEGKGLLSDLELTIPMAKLFTLDSRGSKNLFVILSKLRPFLVEKNIRGKALHHILRYNGISNLESLCAQWETLLAWGFSQDQLLQMAKRRNFRHILKGLLTRQLELQRKGWSSEHLTLFFRDYSQQCETLDYALEHEDRLNELGITREMICGSMSAGGCLPERIELILKHESLLRNKVISIEAVRLALELNKIFATGGLQAWFEDQAATNAEDEEMVARRHRHARKRIRLSETPSEP